MHRITILDLRKKGQGFGHVVCADTVTVSVGPSVSDAVTVATNQREDNSNSASCLQNNVIIIMGLIKIMTRCHWSDRFIGKLLQVGFNKRTFVRPRPYAGNWTQSPG